MIFYSAILIKNQNHRHKNMLLLFLYHEQQPTITRYAIDLMPQYSRMDISRERVASKQASKQI